jgi:hypothetical protein
MFTDLCLKEAFIITLGNGDPLAKIARPPIHRFNSLLETNVLKVQREMINTKIL